MKFYSLSVCVECMYLCARVCRCVYTCACAHKFTGQCWLFSPMMQVCVSVDAHASSEVNVDGLSL